MPAHTNGSGNCQMPLKTDFVRIENFAKQVLLLMHKCHCLVLHWGQSAAKTLKSKTQNRNYFKCVATTIGQNIWQQWQQLATMANGNNGQPASISKSKHNLIVLHLEDPRIKCCADLCHYIYIYVILCHYIFNNVWNLLSCFHSCFGKVWILRHKIEWPIPHPIST